MDVISYIFEHVSAAWPSILMGALIPCAVILALCISKNRGKVPFVTIFYGFATFFIVLLGVGLILVILSQTLLPAIALSSEADGDRYIYIGGIIVLAVFYLASEFLKQGTFMSCSRHEKKNRFVGLTFGSGFILAQNLLVLGLVYTSKLTARQSLVFGLLMLICGVIYLLISSIGYQLILEGHRYVGLSLSASYYLMLAVMLIFSNVVITYSFVARVLIFNLVMGYVLLPLPFKKKGAAS